eukprot:6072855-Amphidinium_carterae.1
MDTLCNDTVEHWTVDTDHWTWRNQRHSTMDTLWNDTLGWAAIDVKCLNDNLGWAASDHWGGAAIDSKNIA